MLSKRCVVEDVDPVQWERLRGLGLGGPPEVLGQGPEAALRFAIGAEGAGKRAAGELWFGLPWARLERFSVKMLPPSCCFVLGVFDGDALWASCLVRFQDGEVVGLSTSAALPEEDLRDVVGRDQHPFLLAVAANRYHRPAFGWFCERPDFEAWARASAAADQEEVFQRALMAGRATFDFNILLDRGLTVLGPINPGEAAVAGADREANPRTRTPGPDGADAGRSGQDG